MRRKLRIRPLRNLPNPATASSITTRGTTDANNPAET